MIAVHVRAARQCAESVLAIMKFGIDRLLADPALRAPLRGRRVALLAHPASVTAGLAHSLDALAACRDIALAAGVLWLSGSVWLAAAQHYRWLGWLQMAAALVSFAWYRSLRRQVK